jgi:hypothetical protein
MQTSTGTVPAVTIDNAFNNSDFGGQSMPAPTYYPGTTSASTATSVRLAAGEERGGIDFQAQPTTTVTVQGLVISPGGSLPAGISVQMMSDDAEAGAFSASGRVDAEGRFTFRNVAPGQYALTARAQPSPPAPMPAVNGTSVPGTPQAAAAKPLYGRTVVIVSDTNVNGIAVTLDAGRTVAGHVVFDGSAKVPDLSKSRLNASMQIAPGVNQTMPSSNVIVGADGHFSITGVQPGRYVLRVTGAQGWYLRSSTINGQDALDVPVEIGGQDVQNAVVTFVDRTTELSGLLQDSQSQPAPDYTIVVFSADERFWPGSTRRVVQTRPATDGRYTITNLPPGDYYIAALTDMEPGASSDPQFLRLLVSSAARITLNDGDKKTQDLRVGR